MKTRIRAVLAALCANLIPSVAEYYSSIRGKVAILAVLSNLVLVELEAEANH